MTKKFALALVSLMVLAAIAVGSASAAAYAVNITPGSTVFVGESGLNISAPMNYFPVSTDVPILAYYASGTNPGTDQPTITYSVNGTEKNFFVSPGMFSSYIGAWYAYNGTVGNNKLAFYVSEPSLGLAIFNNETRKDITDKKVVSGESVTFRISTNMYSLFNRVDSTGVPAQNTGISISLKTPDGASLINVINNSQTATSLQNIRPDNSLYFLINNDVNTGAWQLNISQYSAGTYEVTAKCNVNGMKDNLGSITGKTVSTTGTLEVDKETVTVTADKETVIRNNDFTVTIEGKPSTIYYVWLSGTAGSSYNFGNGTGDVITDDIPPQFSANQDDVNFMNNLDNTAGVNLNYVYKTGAQIRQDVVTSNTIGPNPYAVNVTTGSDGTITVGIETHQNTKAATYTIRAQLPDGTNQLYDSVKVKVEKGSVTVTASGDGSYYLGEEVTFSGTNTDSDYTYLFMTGPNLSTNGVKVDAPNTPAVSGQEASFVRATVKTDNTWEFKLDTSGLQIDAGTYTVYAVNEPLNKGDLSNAKYDTVSIVVKKPFVTATVSSPTVAKGDSLYIRGTAEGNPTQGVGIWILGKNYWNGAWGKAVGNIGMVTESVNDDGSFEYEFGSGDTVNLASGQYFVVVQHPMYNDRFDVDAWEDTVAQITYVFENVSGIATSNTNFIIWGTGKLQGSDAAEALITSINSADIDDTYTKLTFLVEEPWIRINSIGDHYVGDNFAISGTTNLAVGDDIIVEVTSSSFQPTEKTQSGEFSGQSQTVKVVEGETYNEWSMDVDASTFKADEYIVTAESIETTATATTTFNILKGGQQPTSTSTVAPTTGPVTVTPTATQATPTSTAAPGFGALVALIGLGAVAALVLRKE